jgi:acetoacetate decarboxylase
LKPLYNTLNTGSERTRNLTEPKHLGYRGEELRREYVAEATRAYMTDPNYMKTVAPKTAADSRICQRQRAAQESDPVQLSAGCGSARLWCDAGDESSR